MTTDATQVRDVIFALLETMPGFKTVRRVAVRQLQPDDMPALTLVLAEENAIADEDATAGPPHFVHEVSFHISAVRGFGDPNTLDDLADADVDALQNLLLRNVALNQMIEGVSGMRRTRDFPQQGETYFVESRLELTMQIRTTWNPIITDDFTGMNVWARPISDQRDACRYCHQLSFAQDETCEHCGALAFPGRGKDWQFISINPKGACK